MQSLSLLFLAFCLTFSTAYACGIHDGVDQLYSSEDKQFPNPDITYDPDNSEHRGWRNYLTKTLHGTRKLVLTYDDGPHPINTPRLLDILKKHNAKATFFVVAALAEKYPAITKRIVDEGHILAGHDWQHDNSNSETEEVFKEGLTQDREKRKKYFPQREMYYRFPYGAYGRPNRNIKPYHHFNSMKEVSQTLFQENCINFAFWDIDTSDWVSDMKPDDIVETLFANLNGGKAWRFKKSSRNGRTVYIKDRFKIKNPVGGGVILMHDIHSRTVEASEKFLNKIKGTSIEIVPLNQVEEFEYSNQICRLFNPLAL